MKIRIVMLLAAGLFLAGCETYSAPRYGLSADNIVALKSLPPGKVKVGSFTEPKQFGSGCRAAGPITAADNMGMAAYIAKALADELKIAERYDDMAPVTLTGSLDALAFSSSVGFWDIALTVTSSNGKSVSVSEHYEFPAAFTAASGCKRVAEAYFPAVQNTIRKLVKSPEFASMTRP
jgi:hypothetical protein